MKELKINKKVVTAFIYTFLIIGSISFAVYPKTNSLFIKEKNKVLAYTTDLSETYKGIIPVDIKEEDSNIENARFTISLNRETDESYITAGDKYKLDIKNNSAVCSIVSGSNSGSITINDDVITFVGNNKSGYLDITCPVTKNQDLDITVKLYESVNNEDYFSYRSGSYQETYEEYSKRFIVIPDGNKIPIDSEHPYQNLLTIIQTYIIEYVKTHQEAGIINSKDIYEKYINNFGVKSDNDVIGNYFQVLGINRTFIEEENVYAFILDENFIGYLRTSYWYNNQKSSNTTASEHIYLSASSSDLIKEALSNSINNFVFYPAGKIEADLTEQEKQEINAKRDLLNRYIIKYMEDKKLQYSTETLSTIPGIAYNRNGASIDKYPFIYLRTTILDRAFNYLNDGILRITHNSDPDIMASVFLGDFGIVNKNIPSELINHINNNFANTNGELYKSIICTSNCSDYNEIYYANNKYYNVKVTHNETDKYNEIKITEGNAFTEVATGLYDANIIAGIQNNITEESLLNKAITCSSNCTKYSEIYYNAQGTDETSNYFEVSVIPNSYNINSIKIDFYDSFDEITIEVNNEDISGSIAISYEDGNLMNFETLAIVDNKSYDLHYINGEYYLVEIKYDSVNKTNSFVIYNGSIDDMLKKITTSYSIYTLKENAEAIKNIIINNGYEILVESPSNSNSDYTIITARKK